MTFPPASTERSPEALLPLRTLVANDRFLMGSVVFLFAAVFAAPLMPGLSAFSLSRHIGLPLVLLALAKRPRFERPEESRFWRDFGIAMGLWLLSRVALAITPRPLPTLPDLLIELLYGGQYVAWCLLLERCPHQADRRRAELQGTLIQPVVATFVLGFFLYFGWIPKLYPAPGVEINSTLFYFTLDSYVLLRFLLLRSDARDSPHWARIYSLFSLFLFLVLLSYPEDLFGANGWPPLLLALDPILWTLPFVFLLLAVRLRTHRPKQTADRQQNLPSLIDTPSLQTLLATLLFPVVHFTGYLTGLLRESQRRPREFLLMAFLATLGFMAMAQHRRSHQRARDLARRKAVTASALAKNQASLRLIQERRRTQEDLRRAEARNAAIFRASPSGLLLCDLPQGIVREVNQNLERLCARPEEDLLDQPLETLGLWEDPKLHVEMVQRLREGQRIYREPLDLCLADGSKRPVRLSAELLEGQDPASLLLVLRDQKSHAPQVDDGPELTHLRTLTLVLDEDDRICAASPTTENRIGLSLEELKGRTLEELPPPLGAKDAASKFWSLPLGSGRLILVPASIESQTRPEETP